VGRGHCGVGQEDCYKKGKLGSTGKEKTRAADVEVAIGCPRLLRGRKKENPLIPRFSRTSLGALVFFSKKPRPSASPGRIISEKKKKRPAKHGVQRELVLPNELIGHTLRHTQGTIVAFAGELFESLHRLAWTFT